jgi:hypothetical protein
MAALALAGCASIQKAADDARSLATHQREQVAYPDLADIPDKPARPVTAEEHKAAVQSLQHERDAVNGEAEELRDQAAAMPPVPAPGQQPAAPAPRPGQ